MLSLGIVVFGIFIVVMVILGRNEQISENLEKTLVLHVPAPTIPVPVPVVKPLPEKPAVIPLPEKTYKIICRDGFEYYSDLGAPRFDPVNATPKRCQ
jgi:hypothetical protein